MKSEVRMKKLLNVKVRLWAAIMIAVVCIAPAFVAGWAAGVHGGFDTGSRVTALQLRNALREGIRDRFDFFITDLSGIRFRPINDREVDLCLLDDAGTDIISRGDRTGMNRIKHRGL